MQFLLYVYVYVSGYVVLYDVMWSEMSMGLHVRRLFVYVYMWLLLRGSLHLCVYVAHACVVVAGVAVACV